MNQEEEKHHKVMKIINMVNESEISSLRSVVSGIVNVINDPSSSAKDLKDIIEIDPPLAAKVLRVANSAYYYSPNRISEIQHAIIWIGFNVFKELALSQKICQVFEQDVTIHGYSGNSLWKHSVAVGLLGKMIYRREFGKRGENAYAAGLLHDIGIIVEQQFLQKDFNKILSKTEDEKVNLSQLEHDVLGLTHADVGKAITGYWNFPEEFVVAIGHHHTPHEVTQEFLQITSTLYIADCLCQQRGIGYSDAPFQDRAIFQKWNDPLELHSSEQCNLSVLTGVLV